MPTEARSGDPDRRPDIEMSWRRAALSGLDPGMEVRETAIVDVEKRTSLSTAAGPVLDKMVIELADTRFAVLLADRTSRIIDRRVDNPVVARALDRVLAVPGLQYLEETSGTNSLATAFELRRPISVTGDEHFLEALRYFCCYGAPIIHPVTHRVEGVIDVSGPVADATALLGPFLMRAVKDIEARLLEGARLAEKHLLAEFQTHGHHRHAVVALGEGVVLTNNPAVDLIKGVDHAALREVAAELSDHFVHERELTLTSGAEVLVRAKLVAGTRGGAVFEILDTSTQSRNRLRPLPARIAPGIADDQRNLAENSAVVAVIGEPGTGRTSLATTLAGANCNVFNASKSVEDEQGWLLQVRAALTASQSVVIDDIDTLSTRAVHLLAPSVRDSAAQVILTSAPLVELEGPHRALVSMALTRHDLQPVRLYLHKLPSVVKTLLTEIVPDTSLEISPSALRMLAAQPWPGNLREVRAVLDFAARGRQRGTIREADLPESIQMHGVPARTLTMMESAERDTIISALRESNGNRAKAASKLGIGRTTLYARLRRYNIADVLPSVGVRNPNSTDDR